MINQISPEYKKNVRICSREEDMMDKKSMMQQQQNCMRKRGAMMPNF